MIALRFILPKRPGTGLAVGTIAAMVLAAVPAEAARPMEARGAAQRIEPIYDLPNASPYRRDGQNLDLGYLYTVPQDKSAIAAAYRRGQYVLYTGDRYLTIGDRILLLIEQNLGTDPLVKHYARRIAGEPAPEAAPEAEARPAAKQDRVRVHIPPPDEDASEEKPAPATASPDWTIDNGTLVAATAFLLLIIAAFRLAGAMRAKRRGRRTRSDGRSGTSHIGASRNRLTARLDGL